MLKASPYDPLAMRRFLCPTPGSEITPLTRPPTFSVIIAAYQAAALIGEGLRSALEQTSPPLEVVVCDDGSTDDLDSALSPFAQQIILLRQANRGESAAKNAAARAARGEFVVVLDADDVFMPERLHALGELASLRPDLDVLTTDALLEFNGSVIRRCYEDDFGFETADQRRGILQRNFVFGLAAVRRQRLLEVDGFDETIRYAADWDLWVRLVFSGSRIGCVAEPLARYRLQPGSLSAQRGALIDGRVQTLRKAQTRDDLSDRERTALDAALGENRRLLLRTEAREALVSHSSRARRLALRLALSADHPAATRCKAALAALSPVLARRLLRDRAIETTGGVTYRRGP
jgi:hypothetical protein